MGQRRVLRGADDEGRMPAMFNEMSVSAPAVRGAGASARPALRPVLWLSGVSAAFVAAQLLLVVPGSGLGWDETVYTSQVSRFMPAAFFSAPRARGITFLAAPVAQLTYSTVVLRVWMALLSGVGLFAALWVWRSLLPVRVLAAAGGLFTTLWITVYYGPQVMPNLWGAYGVLMAVGCFLRAARDRSDRWALTGLATGVIVIGLMRPLDAVWLVTPLAVLAVAVPRWRRPALLAVLAVGLMLGCALWVVEAYLHYGGLAARLQRGSEIQGGMGWHLAVDDQIRALDGRSLCRPCDVPWRHKIASAWWFALPVLSAVGLMVAARTGRAAIMGVPVLVAGCVAAPYLFLIDYAAPRFLLPAYALLALPVAQSLHWLVTAARGPRLRPLATVLVAVAVCGHLVVQYTVLRNTADNNRKTRAAFEAAAARLHVAGVRPPCVLSGDHAVPMAYYTRCASRQTAGPDASITPDGVQAAALTHAVAVLVPPGGRPPGYARSWRPLRLADTSAFRGYLAYLATPPPTNGAPR
nr:hypothetical protein [Streptomyces sp. RS2]